MINGLPENADELALMAVTADEEARIYGLRNGLLIEWANGTATRIGRWDPPLSTEPIEEDEIEDAVPPTVDGPGKTVAMEDDGVSKNADQVKTVTLKAEEIFSSGKYNGDEYSEADLDAMVAAFKELKGRLDPPLKLGHNDKQADAKGFERDDGKPAMGWVENLRRVGKKLVADFVQVPQQVADWVKEGRYKKKSAEIYWGFKDGGKAYSRVLKAVALLGADIPANRDIASLKALYDEQGNEYRVAEYAEEGDADKVVTLEEVEQELTEFGERLSQATKGRVGAPAIRQFLSEIRTKMRSLMSRKDHTDDDADYAELSTEAVNDLPDAAFAAIMPGGKKDADGKTTPRSLRMLPHHGPGVEDPMDHDSVDMPHLRNAMARMKQADMPAPMMKRAAMHLQAHAKAKGMDSDEMDKMMEEVKNMEDVEALTKKYAELSEQLAVIQGKATEAEAARTKAEADAKSYADKLAAVETNLATERKARRMSELKVVAADFAHIPGSIEEKADKLYRLEAVDTKLYDERVAEWRAVNAQIEDGGLFRQYSAGGERPTAGSAQAQLNSLVQKAVEAGTYKSQSDAAEAVYTAHPRLYAEAQREHDRRATRGGE